MFINSKLYINCLYYFKFKNIKGEFLILKEGFEKVFHEYPIAINENLGNDCTIASFIRENITKDLKNNVYDSDLTISSLPYDGDLFEIPWISLNYMDQELSIDISYLFRKDMSGVYLTLKVSYGDTFINRYDDDSIQGIVKTKAKYIREFLENSDLIFDDLILDMDLREEKSDLNINLFKLGNIVCKFYDAKNFPSDDELIIDLNIFLNLYKFVLENYEDETEISVEEWSFVLENKNIIDPKMFNILKILQRRDHHSGTTFQIADERTKIGFPNEKSYNRTIVLNSKRVKEFLNKKPIFNLKDEEKFWSRFFYGVYVEEGFEFKLKDELVEALDKIDRLDIESNIQFEDKMDNVPEKYNSFYNYLLKKEYLFDKETIENYLLSLKVKPFVILTGNSGTGKTKLSQLFAKYLSEIKVNDSNTLKVINIQDDYVTVKAKTNYSSWANTGWTLNKKDFINLIPISECEGNFDINIDGIPGIGTINLLVQLYYDKNSQDLIDYFNKKYEENPNQIVDLKINTESIKKFCSDNYMETNGSIILKQNSNKSAYKDRQWFMSKEFFKYIPFKNGYTNCTIVVDNFESSARIRITPKLTFKKNEIIQKYLEENEGKVVDVEIKVDKFNFENFKPIWSNHKKEYNDEDNGDLECIYENYKIIPVGANWTENRHIVGYYNVITNNYQSTPAYDLIKQTQESTEPHFLILDEMNLSHVERYFADFLSAIESGENIPLYGEKELEIPPNLFIIGTVNVDETTYMFSPKVLDRANVLEFETYSSKDYMLCNFKKDNPSGNIEYLEDPLAGNEIRNYGIDELHELFSDIYVDRNLFWDILSKEITQFQSILKKSGFDFGFRVINEIVRFMAVAWEYEGRPYEFTNWTRYFDACIKQKLLPKLHGSEKIIGETLDELYEICLDSTIVSEDMAKYPESYKKLKEMRKVLRKQRYVSFIN